MQAREWILTAAVVIVPLIIAVVVTLWSLEQVRYRPKKRQPVRTTVSEAANGDPAADRGREP
jgi:hypothetical protein